MFWKELALSLVTMISMAYLDLVPFHYVKGPLADIEAFTTFYEIRTQYQCAELCYYRRNCVSFSFYYLRSCILSMQTWSPGGKLLYHKLEPKKNFYGEKKDIPPSLITNGCTNHTCAGGTVCVGQGANRYICIPDVLCADQHPWCLAGIRQYWDKKCFDPNISPEKHFAVRHKCNKACNWC